MQGVVQIVRELRGGSSSGALATWCEYSLYVRDEKQGRHYRVRAAGKWEDINLVEEAEIWNERVGLMAVIMEDPILDSYRESIRKLCLSNTLQYSFKIQKV